MKKVDIYYQKASNPVWEGRLVASNVPYRSAYAKVKELAKLMKVSEEDFEIF